MVKTRHAEHGENKEKVTMTLTPTAVANLSAMAETLGISRSELVDQIGLGKMNLDSMMKQMLGKSLSK